MPHAVFHNVLCVFSVYTQHLSLILFKRRITCGIMFIISKVSHLVYTQLFVHEGTNKYAETHANIAGNWKMEYLLISGGKCFLLGHVWN